MFTRTPDATILREEHEDGNARLPRGAGAVPAGAAP